MFFKSEVIIINKIQTHIFHSDVTFISEQFINTYVNFFKP